MIHLRDIVSDARNVRRPDDPDDPVTLPQRKPTWLVGHDFSREGERAAEVAVDELVARGGGTVILLHVVSITSLLGAMESRSIHFAATEYRARLAAEARLRVEARRLLRRGVTIDVLARVGDPAETIVREAAAARADRVVVGSRGRWGLVRALWGSVADRVSRTALVPTLVTRALPRDADQQRSTSCSVPGLTLDAKRRAAA